MTYLRLILLAWLTVLGFGASAAELPVDALLDKVIAAYGGGNGAPTSAKAIKQTGVTYSAMRGGEAPILRAYQRPDRLRIEIRYPGKAEVRVLRGTQAWKQGSPMTSAFQGAMLLQATRMGMPWNLLAIRDRLRDMGSMAMPGGTLRVLEWTTDSGLVMRIGIAPDSGHIVHSLGRLSSTPGSMEFGTTYEDFRHQDGQLYAAFERHFAMGQSIGHTRIEHVEFLDSLPDSLFQPDQDQPPGLRL